MKRFYYFFILLFITFFVGRSVFALTPTPTLSNFFPTTTPPHLPTSGAPRYSACDACGYCPPNPTPGSWVACQRCLYPGISSNATTGDSLKVNPATNLPTTPYPGHQYTFLGCLTTGEAGGSFQTGGGGGVIQTLLRIIFSIVGGVAFLYILYGAFVILTSQNNPEKLNYGKRLVYGAIIGLIFSLASILIINVIANQVLQIPGFGNAGL